jgi:hypothetical protein
LERLEARLSEEDRRTLFNQRVRSLLGMARGVVREEAA